MHQNSLVTTKKREREKIYLALGVVYLNPKGKVSQRRSTKIVLCGFWSVSGKKKMFKLAFLMYKYQFLLVGIEKLCRKVVGSIN